MAIKGLDFFRKQFLDLESIRLGDCCIIIRELNESDMTVYMKINEKPESKSEIYMIILKNGMLQHFKKKI